MIGRMLQRLRPGRLWLPLFVEAVLIASAALVGPQQTSFIWLLAGAMGIQATAITRVHGMAISTVVVTSTMARLAETAVDALAGDSRSSDLTTVASTGAALMWLSDAGGAIAAVLLMKLTSLSIFVSAAVVLLVSVRLKTNTATTPPLPVDGCTRNEERRFHGIRPDSPPLRIAGKPYQ